VVRETWNPGDPVLDPYTGQQVIDDETGLPEVQVKKGGWVYAKACYASGDPTWSGRCHSIAQVFPWALVQIEVENPVHEQAMRDHPQVFVIFETDNEAAWDWNFESLISQTPNSRGWPVQKMIRIRDFLSAHGVDVSGLNMNSTIKDILIRIRDAVINGTVV